MSELLSELTAPPPPDPERLGKYRIDAVLGRGAMGVVYRGFDTSIDRVVAIKTLLPSLRDQPRLIERFSTEARAAARCLHPNLVALFELADHEGMPFIVMEHVEGRDLHKRLKDSEPLARSESVRMVLGLLSGLALAHEHQIVHRDIKPANVIVLDDGRVKLMDFGVAKLDPAEAGLSSSGIIGTPRYMAPEQFKRGPIDHRADLFAVGVVLYQLLAWRRPYQGRTLHDLMQEVVHGPSPDLAAACPEAPVGLVEVVRRALLKPPEARFQSADEFAKALRAAASRIGLDRAAPGHWTSEQLAEIEADLRPHVGPMARVLVARAASDHPGVDPLYQALASHILDASARSTFLSRASLRECTAARGGTPGGVSDAVVAEATRQLTTILGPMARVHVKLAAGSASDARDLYQRLVQVIPDEKAREQFLAGQPAR